MCDWSLENYSSRPAVEGECLEVKTFRSGSKGLVSSSNSEVAVCLRPGSRVVFRDVPLGLLVGGEGSNLDVQEAVFVQRTQVQYEESFILHRDAFDFGEKVVSIQDMPECQLVDVLSIPEENIAEVETSKEAELVLV